MLLQAAVVLCLSVAPDHAIPSDDILAPSCAHAKTAGRLLSPPAFAGVGGDENDVLHYGLDIEIDPSVPWIQGTNTITARSLMDGLDRFRFRIQDVYACVIRCGGAAVWNRIDDATIEVTLDRLYDAGEEFVVEVDYSGQPSPPSGGFGSIEFRTRGGAQEVWTLSEPWFAYTWWPAKDDLYDKTTADLWYTVPDDMVVASNGVLQGVDAVGGFRLRYRWKTTYETADYLYCIGATNYETFGDSWNYDGGVMPLEFYIYPEDNRSENRAAWRQNVDMLDVFSARYGVYPFVDEKYGMCQVGFGGGMEHQTMTSQGGFWESITAHELAHQWFGDMITCGSWHDIWLNEGFATYSEAIWYGEKPGGNMSAYHDRMDYRRPSSVDDSVYVYDISDVGRIFSGDFTYRKAAWVLHMLRHVLGDGVFFDVLTEYRNTYASDSAVTEDFKIVAEVVSGRDLDWFFETWIYDIGAPAYRSAWRLHEAAGKHWVELYVKQVQDVDYPLFPMPIDVAMDSPSGDTVAVAWNDEPAEHLLIEAPGVVTGMALDPEDWILHTSNQSTAFVEGPPKIVATSPEPGGSIESSDELVITITFHEDVIAAPENFALVGDIVGAIGFDLFYEPGTMTVTLDPNAAPPADMYTLTITDGVVDVAAGLALDGEMSDPADPAALPSGEGLAGGTASIRLEITGGAVTGDANGDGVVDFGDILAVLGSWGPCGSECPADVNGDGVVNFADLLVVLGNWS